MLLFFFSRAIQSEAKCEGNGNLQCKSHSLYRLTFLCKACGFPKMWVCSLFCVRILETFKCPWQEWQVKVLSFMPTMVDDRWLSGGLGWNDLWGCLQAQQEYSAQTTGNVCRGHREGKWWLLGCILMVILSLWNKTLSFAFKTSLWLWDRISHPLLSQTFSLGN